MRILLAMPRLGSQVVMKAAEAFYHPIFPDSQLRVRCVSPMSSGTTGNFNSLWVMGWNEWEAGDCDAFAMQHSDIAPCIGWLDILHAEMKATGADVVAAVPPIKGKRGVTSTAVDGPDEWRVSRRLTQHEVNNELPATFTDEDVGEPLLMNTGLWLARLGPWCLNVHFRDRTHFKRGADGNWLCLKISEDWDFGRQLREQGVKMAYTSKVHLEHWGEFGWSSNETWGIEHEVFEGPKLAATG